jgi:hypothetical protein
MLNWNENPFICELFTYQVNGSGKTTTPFFFNLIKVPDGPCATIHLLKKGALRAQIKLMCKAG